MEKNQYQSLLRILYRYQSETLLVYETGLIQGLVSKHRLEEQLSDLSHAGSDFTLPATPAEMEDVLLAISKSTLIENNRKALPVIDNNGKFLGLWDQPQILRTAVDLSQSHSVSSNNEKPESLKTIPQESSNQSSQGFINSDIKIEVKETNNEIDLQMESTNRPPGKSRGDENKKTINENDFSSAEYISIKTLESLPIPMLAVDTKGAALFYNQDWVELQKQNREILGIKKIMDTAKDLMAKLAFDGELEITSILELPTKLIDHELKMRSILDDTRNRPEVIGYIFWTENRKKEVIKEIIKEVIKEIPQKRPSGEFKKNTSIDETHRRESNQEKKYLGKTLVELLREEEKKILLWAMNEADGNQSNAAMLLGIPRQTFSFRYNKILTNKMSNKLK